MKKVIFFLTLISLFYASMAYAVCPVCTIAVGAGVGLSRWLGVDDMISGLWIGGLILSMSLWLIDWLTKKQIKFPLRWLVITALFYAITIVPLYWTNIMGHPFNRIYGMDRLLFGIIIGSIIFYISNLLNIYLKKRNNDKPYFPYQKVAIPVSLLLITSLIFYYIILRI